MWRRVARPPALAGVRAFASTLAWEAFARMTLA